MPIMAAHERSDARGAARLLATMALDCIGNPEIASDQEVALNNVYRMLESYRTNQFFGQELQKPQRPLGTAEKLTLMPTMERHVKEVRDALEHARVTAFAGKSKQQAIASIEKVLRALAYPNLKNSPKPSTKDLHKAALFFKKLIEQLQLG